MDLTDNAPTNEAEKGLLRTSRVGMGLIREGPWAAILSSTGEKPATPVAGCIRSQIAQLTLPIILCNV
jgi:hypothetical protein